MTTDFDLRIQKLRRDQRHEWRVEDFCRVRGIRRCDLEQHPHWHDLLLLIEIRHEFALELASSKTLKGVFDSYWGHTYARRTPLRPRGLSRLERMVQQCIELRIHRHQQRQLIQAQRAHRQTQKADHDMTAKGSGQPHSMSAKGELLVCREDLSSAPPWA